MNRTAPLPLWTVPDSVSASRVGLAVAFALVGDVGWRLALIGVASTTDFLDGWLARRRGGSSRFGALIDAVSDRAFVITAIAVLAAEGALVPLEVLIFLSRDLATAMGYLIAQRVQSLRTVPFAARTPGKVVTVLQFLALVVATAAPRRIGPMIAVLAFVSAFAIFDYTRAVWRARTR